MWNYQNLPRYMYRQKANSTAVQVAPVALSEREQQREQQLPPPHRAGCARTPCASGASPAPPHPAGPEGQPGAKILPPSPRPRAPSRRPLPARSVRAASTLTLPAHLGRAASAAPAPSQSRGSGPAPPAGPGRLLAAPPPPAAPALGRLLQAGQGRASGEPGRAAGQPHPPGCTPTAGHKGAAGAAARGSRCRERHPWARPAPAQPQPRKEAGAVPPNAFGLPHIKRFLCPGRRRGRGTLRAATLPRAERARQQLPMAARSEKEPGPPLLPGAVSERSLSPDSCCGHLLSWCHYSRTK
ncbi:proline-rich protein HaeIII subfamily 1-like [Anomalospiza imberbis]|uniref:proline-rich protein HaeIII subfamily 1-like n=1 Tax=Anomalospiza imberbis TaxID=187417 RepID=UPI00358E0BEB